MPILDSIKDPATGKIKPVILIGGGGIAIVGVMLLIGKSGGSAAPASGVSGGISGDNTGSLGQLQQAVQDLAAAMEPSGSDSTVVTTPVTPPGTTTTTPTPSFGLLPGEQPIRLGGTIGVSKRVAGGFLPGPGYPQVSGAGFRANPTSVSSVLVQASNSYPVAASVRTASLGYNQPAITGAAARSAAAK